MPNKRQQVKLHDGNPANITTVRGVAGWPGYVNTLLLVNIFSFSLSVTNAIIYLLRCCGCCVF